MYWGHSRCRRRRRSLPDSGRSSTPADCARSPHSGLRLPGYPGTLGGYCRSTRICPAPSYRFPGCASCPSAASPPGRDHFGILQMPAGRNQNGDSIRESADKALPSHSSDAAPPVPCPHSRTYQNHRPGGYAAAPFSGWPQIGCDTLPSGGFHRCNRRCPLSRSISCGSISFSLWQCHWGRSSGTASEPE